MSEIKSVTFYFIDGADSSKVDELANKAQYILGLKCSGGGYTPDMHYENFSKDTMLYEYRKPKEKQQKSNQTYNQELKR